MLPVLRWFLWDRSSTFASRGCARKSLRQNSGKIASIETLENRLLLTVLMTPHEQLLLELVNRAREDPQAEAALQGISVEQTGFRAPLAPQQMLIDTAGGYSQRMLDEDFFSHTDPDGNGPLDRVLASGYSANLVGENIAWVGSTGRVDPLDSTFQIHRNLFQSAGHRAGLLDGRMREAGFGLRIGEFIDPRDGRVWNAMMGTEVFAARNSDFFLTGVAFTDSVTDDAFYTVGEELAGVTVAAVNQDTQETFTTTTGPSGGYSLEVPDGTYSVTFSGGGLSAPSVRNNVTVAGANRKVDFDQSNRPAPTLPENIIVTSTGAGVSVEVRVLDAQTGLEWLNLAPYVSGFRGGAHVATGDVNGDGVLDIVTAPGAGGGPHVMVFDGETGQAIASFMAYDPAFGGGVFVASADIDGDGRDDIITGAGAGGGPHVRVFRGFDQQIISEFFAYVPGMAAGVRVAAGNVDGTGGAEILTAPGPGGGPHVRIFRGQTGEPLDHPAANFFAYAPRFFGGVWVASDDVNADGRADIITGAGAGGGPHVRVFSGDDGSEINGFFAYVSGFLGGVRVASSDVDGDGVLDIVTAPGAGGGPHFRAFQGTQPVALAEGASNFMAYPAGFAGGVFAAGGRNTLARIETRPSATFPTTAGDTLSIEAMKPNAYDNRITEEASSQRPLIPTEMKGEKDDRSDSPPATEEIGETEDRPSPGFSRPEPSLDELFADQFFMDDVLSR